MIYSSIYVLVVTTRLLQIGISLHGPWARKLEALFGPKIWRVHQSRFERSTTQNMNGIAWEYHGNQRSQFGHSLEI